MDCSTRGVLPPLLPDGPRQETTATSRSQNRSSRCSARTRHPAYLARVISAPGYLIAEALLAPQHCNPNPGYPKRPPYDLIAKKGRAA